MKCRHCNSTLDLKFLDLGFQPPSNSYLKKSDLNRAEVTYPLRLNVCRSCWLVQTEDYAAETEFFSPEYAYFSSTSSSWLKHAKEYCKMVQKRFNLSSGSRVIEVASNDGYLLKNFVEMGIPCFGVEPTDSTADAAEKVNVRTIREFFGAEFAKKLVSTDQTADLIIGNNVYAHVPDVNDFTLGLYHALKREGVITLEFPHLMRLVELNQFDTVYHEHYSYYSLFTVQMIFKKAGLRIFDVEEISTHGGSLRIYGCRDDANHQEKESVKVLLSEEKKRGMQTADYYQHFQKRADRIKNDLLTFLIEANGKGKKIAAYGAAAKGNTLLNYAGIKSDLIPFVCDAAEAKQGKYLPGSHIPILEPGKLAAYEPDLVMILPWNIAEEIVHQNKDLIKKGTSFFKAIPSLEIL